MRFPFKHPSFYLIIVFLMLSVADIFREYSSGETMNHLAFEIVVCLCATTWTVYLFLSWFRTREKLQSEIKERLDLNNEYQEWKKQNGRIASDFHLSISKQFAAWGLTPTETEVAFLLLKGLAFKEIATVRESSEKTIRNHAMSIYNKSGLPGRTELFAFFFEDLLKIK
jgi:DNA-binding CsgD family transcriptional regulator